MERKVTKADGKYNLLVFLVISLCSLHLYNGYVLSEKGIDQEIVDTGPSPRELAMEEVAELSEEWCNLSVEMLELEMISSKESMLKKAKCQERQYNIYVNTREIEARYNLRESKFPEGGFKD